LYVEKCRRSNGVDIDKKAVRYFGQPFFKQNSVQHLAL
jgi:hypothetical protein